jgi:ADP-ribosyl-[dinitrogen reductase] hydrolase
VPNNPQDLLPSVIAAAAEAGRMVADEFHRPDGPRFSDHVTAPIDIEIEMLLRGRLMELVPARFVGEEAGVVEAAANGLCWVVDPHDGTRAFLEGKRGSAVSIALLRNGQPVLGVVYAPLSPDRGQDMIAWAEGGGITRNGVPVTIDLSRRGLEQDDTVFLNHGAWQRPVWNGLACAPGRFMPLPSIAYRLARVAVGDGIATQTLRPVNALDIAGGHALLTAAGGVLVAEDGTPVTYNDLGESRPSACFGGAPEAVRTLRARAWRGSTEPRRETRITLSWPRTVPEARLDRAAGSLLGQAVGDALGSQVEFRSALDIVRSYPDGVRDLRASPVWNTIAGQPTDDTELALALARCLAGRGTYDAEAAAAAYARWYGSRPFDCGHTTGMALAAAARVPSGKAAAARDAASRDSQANGSLMRIAPIGIWAGDPDRAARAAMEDSTLTHPHKVCLVSCGAFAAAIASGIAAADAREMGRVAIAVAEREASSVVACVLREAMDGTGVDDFHHNQGWILLALRNAFFHLGRGSDAETALLRTVAAGGDTDTNAAITGALLGAAQGRAAFPVRWAMPVLTSRADAGLGVGRPRPEEYWPDDLIDLAEALLRT